MTASVSQEIENGASAGATSISSAALSNSVAGDSFHAIIYANDVSQTINSISDTQGNTWNLLDGPIVLGSIRFWHYAAYNIVGGAAANTLTVGFSASCDDRECILREITGVSATPIDGHNSASQTAPGTGNNGVTVSATNANQPALISAFALRCFNNTTMAAGTGFVSGIGGSTSLSGAGGFRCESLRVTSAAAQAATFTVGNSGNTVSLIAIFDEQAAAAPQPILYNRRNVLYFV